MTTLAPEDLERLHSWTTPLLDGSIEPTELEQLSQLLSANEAARDYYVGFVAIHSELFWHHESAPQMPEYLSPAAFTGVNSEQQPEAVAAPLFDRVTARVRRGAAAIHDVASNYITLSLLVSGLFFAVLFLSMAHVVLDWKQIVPAPEMPSVEFVARITEVSRARFDKKSDGNLRNLDLFEGDSLLLNSGLVVIEHDTGATVILEGPATYIIEGRNGGFLKLGKLGARVEGETAQGFTINTPSARIEDFGTEFGVEVRDDGAAEVAVLSGRVDIVCDATSGRRSQRVRLVKGQGAVATAVGAIEMQETVSLRDIRKRFAMRLPPVALLVDINADGTNRTATTADFEEATGLTAGTFNGDLVIAFPNDNPGGGAFSQTVRNITVEVSDITNDADGWFSTNNYLLDDGLYHHDGSADPTALITLSGSGLGLAANRSYELYLFAGRKQGHLTVFTFDANHPSDPSGGPAIDVDPPVDEGNETLGTAKFAFSTGASVPLSLVIRWVGGQNVDSNQDAVFSGFALREVEVEAEPKPELN